MLNDEESQRVLEALLQMDKIEMKTLKKAYEQP
jgi:hypothetical protein